jgi:hypothetical protein
MLAAPSPPNVGREGQSLQDDGVSEGCDTDRRDTRRPGRQGKDGLVEYLKLLAVTERAVHARLQEKVLPLQLAIEDKSTGVYTAERSVCASAACLYARCCVHCGRRGADAPHLVLKSRKFKSATSPLFVARRLVTGVILNG